jgi:hypothetical protein
VSLVVLDVYELEDAFLLFETLNARGLELSAGDLLKSHLLSRFDAKLHSAEAIDEAATQWDAMVDVLGGGDPSPYLRHLLLMRHPRVRKADVFPLFKQDITKLGPAKALKELSKMGLLYAEFNGRSSDDASVDEVLADLRGTGTDVHRVALLPGRAFLDAAQFVKLARLAEILSFRWIVTGGNAQELESIYQEAAALLYTSDGEQIDTAIAYLDGKLPSDSLFRDAFRTRSLGYQVAASYALRKIETAIDGKEKFIKPGGLVHVEHVMPQTETPFWASRVGNDVAYDETVAKYGNLTLLLGKVNSSVSNSDWSVKRPAYAESAVLMTRQLSELDDWTATEVELRGRWLADLAVRVWSTTPSIKELPTFPDVVSNPSLLHG